MPLAIFIGFEQNLGAAVGLSFVLLVTSVLVLAIVVWSGERLEA